MSISGLLIVARGGCELEVGSVIDAGDVVRAERLAEVVYLVERAVAAEQVDASVGHLRAVAGELG